MKRRPINLKSKSLAVPLLGLLALIPAACRTVHSSQVTGDIAAGYTWWQEVRGGAADSAAALRSTEDEAGRLPGVISAWKELKASGAGPEFVAAREQEQRLLAIGLAAKIVDGLNRHDQVTVKLLKALQAGRTAMTATEGAATADAGTVPGKRTVKAYRKVDGQFNCYTRAPESQNWGLGGDGSQGVIEALGALKAYVDTNLKNEALGLAIVDPGQFDAGRLARFNDSLRTANVCAADLQRRIDSWWDFGPEDAIACAPFAAGAAGGKELVNPACRQFPHPGYLISMPAAERPCLETFSGNLGTMATVSAEGRAYLEGCAAEHGAIRARLQAALNEVVAYADFYTYQGKVGAAPFVAAVQASPNLKIRMLPATAQLRCDLNAMEIGVPVRYLSAPLAADLRAACGLADFVPVTPACSIQVLEPTALVGQKVTLLTNISGDYTSARWDNGETFASSTAKRTVVIEQQNQEFSVEVTGKPRRDAPAEVIPCRIRVGNEVPPVCQVTLNPARVKAGESATLTVIQTGGGKIKSAALIASPGAEKAISVPHTEVVSPAANTQYRVVCRNDGGETPATANLEVASLNYCVGGPVVPVRGFGADLDSANRCFKKINLECPGWPMIHECSAPRAMTAGENQPGRRWQLPNGYWSATGPDGAPLAPAAKMAENPLAGCSCITDAATNDALRKANETRDLPKRGKKIKP